MHDRVLIHVVVRVSSASSILHGLVESKSCAVGSHQWFHPLTSLLRLTLEIHWHITGGDKDVVVVVFSTMTRYVDRSTIPTIP